MRSKIDSRKRPFGNSEDGSPEAKSPRVECDNTGKDLNVAGSSTGGMSLILLLCHSVSFDNVIGTKLKDSGNFRVFNICILKKLHLSEMPW